MKTMNIPQRLCLFLFTLLLASSALAQSSIFLIGSKSDWEMFRDRVNDGDTTLNAKMTADVEVGHDNMMLGVYCGTFDGQGHTLSINSNSDNGGLSPFKFVNGATIKNLHMKWQLMTSGCYLGGLIYEAYGTTNISNCAIDVNITCSYEYDASCMAGVVARITEGAHVSITDCVVSGTFNATVDKGQSGMAGFVYQQENGATCTLTNCLYLGTNNAIGGNTFAPNATLKNCYYLNTCGTAQGVQVSAEKLRSGEVAHLLQGTRQETVWGQMLGTDTIPQLTDKMEKRAYEVRFTYKNQVAATRYANAGGHVTLPTAKELLGAEYDPGETYTLTFSGGFSATTTVLGDMKVTVSVTTTGIDDVTGDAAGTNGAVYNLQGQRVADSLDNAAPGRLPAGVYIVGGKKIIVK